MSRGEPEEQGREGTIRPVERAPAASALGLTQTQTRLISSHFSHRRGPAPAFTFLPICCCSSSLSAPPSRQPPPKPQLWMEQLWSCGRSFWCRGEHLSLFGAEALWAEEDQPTFPLAPPSQWAVGRPGHQATPACGLHTARAQMPASRTPISASHLASAVCSRLAALGEDPPGTVETAQRKEVHRARR